MCCSLDHDAADVFDCTRPVARKCWRCEECSATVQPGQRYVRIAVLYDGSWATCRNCLTCWGAKERASKLGVFLCADSQPWLEECVPHGYPCDETESAYAEFGASVGLMFALNERRAAVRESKT